MGGRSGSSRRASGGRSSRRARPVRRWATSTGTRRASRSRPRPPRSAPPSASEQGSALLTWGDGRGGLSLEGGGKQYRGGHYPTGGAVSGGGRPGGHHRTRPPWGSPRHNLT